MAVDSNALIGKLVVEIDNVSRGEAPYGGSRQDVCDVYVDFPSCPNVGWSYAVDTTQLVDGWHYIRVYAFTSDGQGLVADKVFYTSNSSAAKMNIDTPASSMDYAGVQVFGDGLWMPQLGFRRCGFRSMGTISAQPL